jgi:hypothetical protein
VAAGEQREIELTVAVGRVASGSVEGRVQARLASDASPEVLNAELPFSFEMHRPVDQARRAWMSVLLLLVGFLLPLAVLWGLNWWGARFEPLARLRTAAVPVLITSDGRLRRIRDRQDGPLSFEASDFENTPGPDEPVREASVHGLHLRSKVPLFPFRAAHGVVSADPQHAVASEGLMSSGTPVRGKVPFNLARQWIFTLEGAEIPEDGEPEVRGTLQTFLPEGPMHRQIGNLVDELARTVPTAAQELAREAARRSPPADIEEEGSAPPALLESEADVWAPPTAGPRRGPGASSLPPTGGGGQGWRASRKSTPRPTGSAGSPAEEGTTRGEGGPSSAPDGSDPGSAGGWQPPQR